MHVIFHGAGLEQRAGEVADDAAGVRVEFIADGVFEDAFPVFGGKDDVDENLSKGLGHGGGGLRLRLFRA